MDKHVDHRWDETIQVHCHLGPKGMVKCYEVFAPDALAVAITGHLAALSGRTGSGVKFRVGPKWWKMIFGSAEHIEHQAEEFDP